MSLSGAVTGSNQLRLPGSSGREEGGARQARRGQAQEGGKSTQKESQIVSRRKGINYPAPKKSIKMNQRTMQKKKLKLYEVAKPFSDPLKEKERQNAINAKKNREKKHSLVLIARQEIDQLRELNKRMQKDAIMEKKKLFAARREIKLLKSRIHEPFEKAPLLS